MASFQVLHVCHMCPSACCDFGIVQHLLVCPGMCVSAQGLVSLPEDIRVVRLCLQRAARTSLGVRRIISPGRSYMYTFVHVYIARTIRTICNFLVHCTTILYNVRITCTFIFSHVRTIHSSPRTVHSARVMHFQFHPYQYHFSALMRS
jgi:hypothetical protein